MQQMRATPKALGAVASRRGLKGFFQVSLYRNAVFLIAASLINSLLGFVFWIVAARFYTTDEVGLGSAAISAVTLLAGFANLGLGYGLIRFLPHSKSPVRMVNTALTAGVLASVAAAVIFLAGLGVWSPPMVFIRLNNLYSGLFIAFVAVFTTTTLVDAAFVAVRRSGFIVTRNLIFSVLKVVAAVALAASFAAFGILSSWGLAAGVSGLVCLGWMMPRALRHDVGSRESRVEQNSQDTGALKLMARFSVGNWVGALLWTAPAQVLALMVVHQLGAEANALFYVAFTIAGILFSIPTMASTSLLAEGSSDERSLRQHVRHSLKLAFAILIPGTAFTVLGAKYLLLPFGGGYADAANLLRLMAVASLPLALNVIYLGVKRVEMRVGTVVLISGLTAALTLGLSWVLLPRMGIEGAGVAWLVGQVITASVLFSGVQKSLKNTVVIQLHSM
jgi:O-antigen/teichoic acid export membrane protein